MAGTLGSLVVDIGADVARLRRDMGKAQRTVKSAMGNIKRIASTASRALSSVGIGLAAGLGGAAIRQAIADTSLLFDNAQKLGLAAEKLQEYQYAAVQVGLSQRTATMAVQRFTRRLAEAAQGTGTLKDTLEEYGIAVRDSSGNVRDSEAVLGDLADAIKGASSDAERLRIAFKAFDSEGVGFVNVMRDGREGLKSFGDEARASGAILEEGLVAAAKELDGRLTLLAQTIEVRFKSAILSLAKTIADAFNTTPQIAWGRELENNRKQAALLEKQIAAIEAGGVTRAERRRLEPLKETLAELVALDPERQIARIDQELANAMTRREQATGGMLRGANERIAALKEERALWEELVDSAKERQKAIDTSAASQADRKPAATKSEIKAARDLNKEAQNLIATFKAQQLQLSLSSEEFQRYEAAQLAAKLGSEQLRAELLSAADAYLAASQAARETAELTSEAEALRDYIKTPFDAAFEALDRYDLLLEKNMITIDEWAEATNKQIDSATDAFEDMKSEGKDAADTLADTFKDVGSQIEDSITDAVQGASLQLSSFKDLAISIFQQIQRQLIQKHIAKPLGDFVMGGLEGIFAGKAMGGPVAAGVPYVVGEKGPELFIPKNNGTIIPNSGMARPSNNVTQKIVIQTNGQPMDRRTQQQIQTAIGMATTKALRRNG